MRTRRFLDAKSHRAQMHPGDAPDERPAAEADKNRLRILDLRSGKSASLNVAEARVFPFGSDFRRVRSPLQSGPVSGDHPENVPFV